MYVYELEIFCEKIAPIMIGNVRNREDIDLLSYEIKYFDFVRNFILVMTETGEFLRF